MWYNNSSWRGMGYILSLQFFVLLPFLRSLLFLTSPFSLIRYQSFLDVFIIRHLRTLLSLRLCGFDRFMLARKELKSPRETQRYLNRNVFILSPGSTWALKSNISALTWRVISLNTFVNFSFYFCVTSWSIFFNIIVTRWTNILIFAHFGYVLKIYLHVFFSYILIQL